MWGVFLAVAVVATPRVEWARGPDVEGCLEGSDLEQRLTTHDEDWFFDVFVQPDSGDGLVADVFVRDAAGTVTGRRRLQAERCVDLQRAFLLLAEIVVRDEAPLDQTPAPPLPPSRPELGAVKLRAELARPRLQRPFARLSTLATVGTLPVPGIGFELAVRSADLAPRQPAWGWTMGAALRGLPTQREGDLAFGLWAGGLQICGARRLIPDRVQIGACVAGWLGGLDAVVFPGADLQSSAPGQYLWAAVGLGPELRIRLVRRLFIALRGHGLASITRQRFVVANDDAQGFQEDPVALDLGLGVEWAF